MTLRTLMTAAVAATITVAAARADTTVTVFHAWPHHAEWQQQVADDFMAQNPDVSIEMQAPSTDYDEGFVSVIRQSMAGRAPDVFMVGSHLLGELAARELAPPLDDVLAEHDLEALGYPDSVLALTRVEGEQVGLPWTSSTPVMFYNAELVRRAGGDPDAMPTSWDATIALAARIDALGDDIMGMYYPAGDDDWLLQNLLANAGLAPITEDGTIALATAQGREAMRLFERFHDEGGQQAVTNGDARRQMYAGRVGLYFNSTAAVRSFEREIGERFDWRTAPMPTLVPDGGVASGGMAAVILATDPQVREAAFDYILYGTGPEGQDTIVRATGYMPIHPGAMAKDRLGGFYADHPAWRTSAEQIDRAYPWFSWPGDDGVRISQLSVDALEAVANDQTGADAAAAALADEIRALIEE